MPESYQPARPTSDSRLVPDHALPAPFIPSGVENSQVLQPLPPLERDRQVLAWLQCSAELDGAVTGYICDALLDWALNGGRPYPDMSPPHDGPDGNHLQALVEILDRFEQRIAETPTVASKLELGRAGRLIRRAVRAAHDPNGVRDAIDRELLTGMPSLGDPPPPYVFADGSVL